MIKGRQLLVRREDHGDNENLNPILADDELGWDDVSKKLKIGDGETEFDDLDDIGGYVGGKLVDEEDIGDEKVLVYNLENDILEYKLISELTAFINQNTEINNLKTFLNNQVLYGMNATAPTTPSTHLDEDAYDFNINFTQGEVIVNGVRSVIEAGTDFDVSHGDTSPLTAENEVVIYSIVAKETDGSISVVSVAGGEVPPTNEQIDTAVGNDDLWIKLFDVTATRTGADSVVVTFDNEVKPVIS